MIMIMIMILLLLLLQARRKQVYIGGGGELTNLPSGYEAMFLQNISKTKFPSWLIKVIMAIDGICKTN